MKIISNIGGVKIEANSHKEFIALLTYAYRCKENHAKEQKKEIRLTRGEK